jgi:hypothetical protein
VDADMRLDSQRSLPDDRVQRATLVREARAHEAAFPKRVRKVLRSSYSSHYRRMLPKLLTAIEFRCTTTPAIDR